MVSKPIDCELVELLVVEAMEFCFVRGEIPSLSWCSLKSWLVNVPEETDDPRNELMPLSDDVLECKLLEWWDGM